MDIIDWAILGALIVRIPKARSKSRLFKSLQLGRMLIEIRKWSWTKGTLIAKPFQASLSEQYSVVLNWLANSWTRHSYSNLCTDLPLAIQRLLHYSEQFLFKHATNKLLHLLLKQIYFPCDVNKLEVMASACTMISASSFSSWLQSQSYLNCVP